VGNCDNEDLIRGMLIDQAVRITPKANVTIVGVVSRE
jgi:hypothetical protein